MIAVGSAAITAPAITTFQIDREGAGQVVQGDRHRLCDRIGHHRDAEEKVVPDVGELEDADDDKGRDRQRQHHACEGGDQAGAVHARGVEQFGGHAGEVVAEDQRRDRDAVDHVHQHQPPDRAIGANHLQEAHQRQQDALVRDEEAEEQRA